MARLPETEAVLAKLYSTSGLFAGNHYGQEPQVGVVGLQIGSVAFDPTIHNPMNVDPFSIMEFVTDEPQVPLVIPRKPLYVRVITESHSTQDDPRIVKLKNKLIDSLIESIDESLPGVGDLMYSYHIGKIDNNYKRYDVDNVETDGTPEANAKRIAEFCRDALAFVISDFNNLPLHKYDNTDFLSTVGIKTNHNSEMALPAGFGIISLGGRSEVNTNNKKELTTYNEASAKVHNEIIARLERIGIKVAQVVFDPRHKYTNGLDLTEADSVIAKAVSKISEI